MRKGLLFIMGTLLSCATQVHAQSIVAYNAHTFFDINPEDTTGVPTFLILPADYAKSQEVQDMELRTTQTFVENPVIANTLINELETNLIRAIESGKADPETIKMLEQEIADVKKNAKADFSGIGSNPEELKAMREELLSHAVVKKYFWAAETMYGNIVAVLDRNLPDVHNNIYRVWGIMNDKGEMIIPCEYMQGEEFGWWNEELDVILLRNNRGIHLFRSDGKPITDKTYREVTFCESDAFTAIVVMLDKVDPKTGYHLYGLVDAKTGREIHQHDYEEILSANGGKGPIYGMRNHNGKRYIIGKDGRETGTLRK